MPEITMKQVEAVTRYLEEDRQGHMKAPHHYGANDAGKMAAALESAGIIIDYGPPRKYDGPPLKKYIVNCVYMTQEEIPVMAANPEQARNEAGAMIVNINQDADEVTGVREPLDETDWEVAVENLKSLQPGN